MTDCTCELWKANIERINAPIVLQQIRTGTSFQCDQFEFCPWCGKSLLGQPSVETDGRVDSAAADSAARESAWHSFANSEPAPTHKECFHAGWVSGKGHARSLQQEPAETGCRLCAEGMNSFFDPASGKNLHARNGEVVPCPVIGCPRCEEFDAAVAECERFEKVLELIAGTHGTECAMPRVVAAQALDGKPIQQEPREPPLCPSGHPAKWLDLDVAQCRVCDWTGSIQPKAKGSDLT